MIKQILLGFLLGIGKIIPGVSGAMIAISFNIYDKLIQSITQPLKNIKFIITIGIGFTLAIVFGSKIILYFMEKHYFLTMTFFIGLIAGGLPKLLQTTYKNNINKRLLLITLISFFIVILPNTFNTYSYETERINYFFLIAVGFIEASTMIIPGISGTAIMMLIGYYDKIMQFFSNIMNLSNIIETIKFGIPFAIGLIIGVYLVSKLINYLLEKYKKETFSVITGFLIGTILIMIEKTIVFPVSIITFIIGIITLSTGFLISSKFDK